MPARASALLLLLFQTTPPAFEVADVKPNKSGQIRMAVDFQPGGRLSAVNVPLKVLIALAYKVRPDAVTGGPAYLKQYRISSGSSWKEKGCRCR